MTTNKETRISIKRKNPNPLFKAWLESLYEESKLKNSKLKPMLEKALDSLCKCPFSLKSGAQCSVLDGFGPKLCLFLDQQLAKYSGSQNAGTPNAITVGIVSGQISLQKSETRSIVEQPNEGSSRTPQLTVEQPTQGDTATGSQYTSKQRKLKCTNKSYMPSYRSGGYAILICLLEHAQGQQNGCGLSKDSLLEMAQKHSDESFVRPKPGTFYTAWSNMTRLIKKGLVEKTKSKKVIFSLTAEGESVAKKLLKDSQSIPTTNDIIFNEEPVYNIANLVSQNPASLQPPDTNLTHENLIHMSAGSFDIVLLIDKNETSGVTKKNDPTVAQMNKYKDMKHEYRSLKVGDFTWIAKHKLQSDHELVLPYIIERKRMDDLASSIKDGRFHEQKFRLRKCGLSNVIYLIEKYNTKHVGLPQNTLMQALANTRVQDGFKIHITDSLSESVRFLAMMTKRLTLEFKEQHLSGSKDEEPSNGNLMSFQYLSKSSLKTKPLTASELFIKLLLQIKGVSVEKALAITSVYKTPSALINAYHLCCNTSDAEMLLANLKYGDTNRNVGPAVSKNLCYLFHKM